MREKGRRRELREAGATCPRRQAWIHPLELEIHPLPKMQAADDILHMFLGARHQVDGERELFRIGRCLDHLYPDDLDRVLLREPRSG